MSRIGQEINKLRLQKGLTPKQLARTLGVSEGFILDIESGRKIISDDMIGRVSKALDFELGPIGLFASEDRQADRADNTQRNTAPAFAAGRTAVQMKAVPKQPVQSQPVQEVWDDAFGNILKTVPVYDYRMDRLLDKKLLPIEKNKVEGFQKEKVFYLDIEDADMSGFRIFKGDRALSVLVGDIDADGIYFVEYNGTRAVRQVKKLQADRLLLVSNKGTLITETVSPKNIKVIARLVKLEISL
ncbi:anaerobic benzoate catabolism transcriptional regulator [Ruminiclostridium hungatei]|uniref:Anaerobic benzoate catabolism transcriptional regulator n=1 Tax=Ruminiclostridium hungatei TaxID=48256 RepID=A0A1V4SKE5_RUMHU|nr:helix-turn-helix transcriptional regulator [Ruminiclostridium hungatei]OPX44372.1 anaerobic benzoate catabolism transcriptional regulator [Ruminiclostridium hungatei]